MGHQVEEEVLLDIGVAKSACHKRFARQTPLRATRVTQLHQADGSPVMQHGGKRLRMQARDGGQILTESFEVKDITPPILSASSVVCGGAAVWFYNSNSMITPAAQAEEVNRRVAETAVDTIALAEARGVSRSRSRQAVC